MRSLKDNMDHNYNRLEEKYSQLEKSITIQNEETTKDFQDLKEMLTKQQNEITQRMSNQMETNNISINTLLEENKLLKQQYNLLRKRLNKIEMNQLSNNAVIIRVPEEPWESYDSTKQ